MGRVGLAKWTETLIKPNVKLRLYLQTVIYKALYKTHYILTTTECMGLLWCTAHNFTNTVKTEYPGIIYVLLNILTK